MLNLSFQISSTTGNNYINMLPHISKESNGKPKLEYNRCTTSQRRSNRSIQSDNQAIESANNNKVASTKLVATAATKWHNDLIVCNYIRCYVEDFMILNVGERLLVFLPAHYYIMTTIKRITLFGSGIRLTEVLFTKGKYSGYMGIVFTNQLIDNVSIGMHLSDYELEFGTYNYCCFIVFTSDTTSESIPITWQEVIDGKKNSVQV